MDPIPSTCRRGDVAVRRPVADGPGPGLGHRPAPATNSSYPHCRRRSDRAAIARRLFVRARTGRVRGRSRAASVAANGLHGHPNLTASPAWSAAGRGEERRATPRWPAHDERVRLHDGARARMYAPSALAAFRRGGDLRGSTARPRACCRARRGHQRPRGRDPRASEVWLDQAYAGDVDDRGPGPSRTLPARCAAERRTAIACAVPCIPPELPHSWPCLVSRHSPWASASPSGSAHS